MITLRELFDVTWSITRVELTARSSGDLSLLHQFWLGDQCDREHLPPGLVHDWAKDAITLSPRKINEHGEPGRGGPEIGWGLKKRSIPDELLDAEIVHLRMQCRDGITYTVSADIIMQELQIEMLKKEIEKHDNDE